MKLRAARVADAEAMAALHQRGFVSAWAAGTLAELLAQPGVFGVLAEAADASHPILGLLLARVVAEEAEILTVCVDPATRSRGVGAALVAAALGLAAQAGAERIFLEVAADNVAALALYYRAGFAAVGRRPAYYQRPLGETVEGLILRADLNSGPA